MIAGTLTAANVAVAQVPDIIRSNDDASSRPKPTVSKLQQTSQQIRLVMRQSSLGSILLALGKVAGQPVIFDDKDVRFARQASVSINEHDVMTAFALVLRGTGLMATLGPDGRTIVVSQGTNSTPSNRPQQKGRITGQVLDSASGEALVGATITVIGTALRAVTNANGRFVLDDVPLGERQLSIRLFGYRPAERTVAVVDSVRTPIRVTLMPVATALSGVVTTATGLQDRRSVGNDITVLNADSIMNVAPVTSVTDLLETRVPGLTVIRSSGIPGAPSRIRLRGVGGGLVDGAANTSNDPIVIVDGMRVYAQQSTSRDRNLAVGRNLTQSAYPATSALDQIDPNSIETIEVFKGPSATSQWGADAGNGVIVITTKKGRPGKTRLDVALNGSMERMPGTYATSGYYRFAHGLEETNSRLCSVFEYTGNCAETDSIVKFQVLDNPKFSPFGTGFGQSGSATLSGGNDAVVYSIVASTNREIGYLRMPKLYETLYQEMYSHGAPKWMRQPTGLFGSSVSTSLRASPKPTLILMLTTSLATTDAARASGTNILSQLSGNYIDTLTLKNYPFGSVGMFGVGTFMERSQSRAVSSNIGIGAEFTQWALAIFRGNVGINTLNREDVVQAPFGFGRASSFDTAGEYSTGTGQAITRSGNLNATLWSGGLVTTVFGVQVTQQTTKDITVRSDSLSPGIKEPVRFDYAAQRTYASTTAGWFVEPRLNIKSRFFVAPGFRLDGGSASSSRQGGGRGVMALFPKLNFSWITVDREGQHPLGGVLSMLRTRLGFGIAGVQPDPSWKLRLMSNGSDDTGLLPGLDGILLRSIGNPDLHPERSREIEGGFEASLWNGRVNMNVTGSSKLRVDAIQQLDLAPSVSSKPNDFYMNIGRIRNTGVEIELNARLVETRSLAWGVGASLSTNRNEITKLAGDQPYIAYGAGNSARLQAGYPVGGRWGRPIVGYNTNPVSGRLSLHDVALADSAVYIGAGFPKWQLPFQTNVSLWNGLISVNAAFDYKNGLTQFNEGGSLLLARMYADPKATLGQQAIALTAYAYQQDRKSGSINGLVQTVSTLRFNTLSFNYSVPTMLRARLHLPRTTLALQGSNLALWTNYRGKDPDVNSVPIGEDILDKGEPPRPRSWTLRVTMSN